MRRLTRTELRVGRLVLLIAGADLLSRLPTAPPPAHVAALDLLITLLGVPAVMGWGVYAWWRQAADAPLTDRLVGVALGVLARRFLLALVLAGLRHGAGAVEAVLSVAGDSLRLLVVAAAAILGALFHLASRLTPAPAWP